MDARANAIDHSYIFDGSELACTYAGEPLAVLPTDILIAASPMVGGLKIGNRDGEYYVLATAHPLSDKEREDRERDAADTKDAREQRANSAFPSDDAIAQMTEYRWPPGNAKVVAIGSGAIELAGPFASEGEAMEERDALYKLIRPTLPPTNGDGQYGFVFSGPVMPCQSRTTPARQNHERTSELHGGL